MFIGVSFKSVQRRDLRPRRDEESFGPLTNDVTHADADELFDGLPVESLAEVGLVFETQRQQVHQERHEPLLAQEVALVALAKDLVDDVLDDGRLRRQQELVRYLRRPHRSKFMKVASK